MVSRTYAYQAIEKRNFSLPFNHVHELFHFSDVDGDELEHTLNQDIETPAGRRRKKCPDDIILLDEYCWHLGVSVC